jgi:hypothetical protein
MPKESESSVGIATGYGLDSWGSIPSRGKKFFSCHSVQSGYGAVIIIIIIIIRSCSSIKEQTFVLHCISCYSVLCSETAEKQHPRLDFAPYLYPIPSADVGVGLP